MSSRPAPAPFTLTNAADRAVRTFAVLMCAFAALMVARVYGSEILAGWTYTADLVRIVWDWVVGLGAQLSKIS